MKLKKFVYLASALAIVFAFTSCNDPEPEPGPNPDPQPVEDDTLAFGNEPLESEPFVDQLVDGGFETYWYWAETSDGRCIDYKSSMLYSLNCLYALKDVLGSSEAPLTTQLERNAHSGKYALKLVTGQLIDEVGSQLLIPGAIAPLRDDFIAEFLGLTKGNITITKPYTAQPKAIKGYFKYLPVLGDSASVTVTLYNNAKDVIGEARWLQKAEVNSWTPFYQQVTYTSNETPAYISLVYSSSAGYDFADLMNCKGRVGSTLWLDDMELEF